MDDRGHAAQSGVGFLPSPRVTVFATAAVFGIVGTMFLALHQDYQTGYDVDRAAFERRMHELAGIGAMDCGSVVVRRFWPTSAAQARRVAVCASDAVRNGRPFFMQWHGFAIDSAISQAIVLGPAGRPWIVFFQEDVMGSRDPPHKGRLGVRACGRIIVRDDVVDCT